jgi:hypothetical protein
MAPLFEYVLNGEMPEVTISRVCEIFPSASFSRVETPIATNCLAIIR